MPTCPSDRTLCVASNWNAGMQSNLRWNSARVDAIEAIIQFKAEVQDWVVPQWTPPILPSPLLTCSAVGASPQTAVVGVPQTLPGFPASPLAGLCHPRAAPPRAALALKLWVSFSAAANRVYRTWHSPRALHSRANRSLHRSHDSASPWSGPGHCVGIETKNVFYAKCLIVFV